MTARLRAVAVPLTALAALSFSVVGAQASQQLGDADVKEVTLQVNARGEALVSYTRADGRKRHVLVWGAVDQLVGPDDKVCVRER